MYRKSVEELDCGTAHPYHWLGGPTAGCPKASVVSAAASAVVKAAAIGAVGSGAGQCNAAFEPMPLPDLPVQSRSWGSCLSTRDLLGPHLLLLAPEGAGLWRVAAEGMAERLGVHLVSHTIGARADLCALGWDFATGLGLPHAGAVLVTPTGLICWCAPIRDDDPERTVARVLLMLACAEDVAGRDRRYTQTGGTA